MYFVGSVLKNKTILTSVKYVGQKSKT